MLNIIRIHTLKVSGYWSPACCLVYFFLAKKESFSTLLVTATLSRTVTPMTAALHRRQPEAEREAAPVPCSSRRELSASRALGRNSLLLLVRDLPRGVVWKSVCGVSTSSLGTIQPVIPASKTPLKARGKLGPKLLHP